MTGANLPLIYSVESTIITTRRPHLCDLCIAFSVYIVNCLVLYTLRLSSYSLTTLGLVVLVQHTRPSIRLRVESGIAFIPRSCADWTRAGTMVERRTLRMELNSYNISYRLLSTALRQSIPLSSGFPLKYFCVK